MFTLPTIFVTGALLFAVAALTGRSLASYGLGAFLFFGAIMAEELVAEQFSRSLVGTLLDPFGFTAVSEMAEYWTPFDRNTLLVPFTGPLLWNRLTWLAVAGGALVLTHARFGLAEGERQRRKAERRAAAIENAHRSEQPPRPVIVPIVPRSFTFATRVRQVFGETASSLSNVFFARYSLLAVAAMLVLIAFAGWESAGFILDTPTWPMTYLVAREVIGDAAVLIIVLTALFAGQLVWRERDAGTSEITDAAPVPDWVRVAGKTLAIIVALTIVQALLMMVGIVLQTAQGYTEYEPALYAKILFGIQLPHYVLWGVFALFAHVVINHKYIAQFLIVVYWALMRFGRGFTGLEHNLLAYGADPGWSYSDISGFEPFLGPWLSFKLYWAAWALVLLVATHLMWVRGRDTRLVERLHQARGRFTRPAAVAASLAIACVLGSGGWVFYNTNILNEYRTRDERRDIRAEYERRYKRYERLPQPSITRCELNVDLVPERRAFDVRGTYVVANDTASAIDSVHVVLDGPVQCRALGFDRAARRVTNDERHRYQIWKLGTALQPGQTMRVRFHVAFAPRGFTNVGASAAVLRNGTFFDRRWMPLLGYQPELEMTGDAERKERGLPPRKRLPPLDDAEALRLPGVLTDAKWMHLETVIGTAPEQTAIAPGSLRRTWTANGQRWFHYATEAPIQNNYAIYSAQYAVREDRWRDVAIQVFHHPRHTFNLDRIVRAMKGTLEYHARELGPYPHRQLRIIEFPRHVGTYARAYPTAIAFSEGFGFMARPEDGIDYPFLVAAHEVSHQWWGNQFRPARVEGAAVLAETLAHYGAMMVLEKAEGPKPVHRFRRMLLHKYLVGRQNRRSTEVPLLRSNEQQYIHYDKGALVMYALRDAIGEERLNLALRRMFVKHRFGAPPYATTRDFYAELKAVTPLPLHPLLRDLIEEITLWELKAVNPRVEPMTSGAYRVTFDVVAAKVKPDAVGRDQRVPMDDLVEIGVFAGEKRDGDPGQPLYLAKHRIRSGEQTISVIVPKRPARVGVDPYQKLIERELVLQARENNLAEVVQPRR